VVCVCSVCVVLVCCYVADMSSYSLFLSCEDGDVDELVRLMENGADINESFSGGTTTLHLACMKGREEVVDVLLKLSTNINSAEEQLGNTALHLAVRGGHLNIATKLMSHGADAAIRNKRGLTPLQLALRAGHYDVTELLLSHTDVNARYDSGETLLHWVVYGKHSHLIPLLIRAGADVSALNETGLTAVHTAVQKGDSVCVDAFITSHPDCVNVMDNNCRKPLHCAVREGYVHIVQSLVSAGADCSDSDCNGQTVLHVAAETGHYEIIKLLLSHVTDVNGRDVRGCTALHCAAASGHEAIASVLLAAGADTSVTDKSQCTPLMLAKQNNHHALVQTLDPSYSVHSAHHCPQMESLQQEIIKLQQENEQMKKYYECKIQHLQHQLNGYKQP